MPLRLQRKLSMAKTAHTTASLRSHGHGSAHRQHERDHLRIRGRSSASGIPKWHLQGAPRLAHHNGRPRAAPPPHLGKKTDPSDRQTQLLPRSSKKIKRATPAAGHDAGAMRQRHGVRPQSRQRPYAHDPAGKSVSATSTPARRFNLPKIGKYDSQSDRHTTKVCFPHSRSDARVQQTC